MGCRCFQDRPAATHSKVPTMGYLLEPVTSCTELRSYLDDLKAAYVALADRAHAASHNVPKPTRKAALWAVTLTSSRP